MTSFSPLMWGFLISRPHLATGGKTRSTCRPRVGGRAFQSRPARLLLCARPFRLVHQPLGAVHHHGRGGDRHLAAAVRIERLESHARYPKKSFGVKSRSSTFHSP